MLADIEVMRNELTEIHQDNLGAISWTSQVQSLRNVEQIIHLFHGITDFNQISLRNMGAEINMFKLPKLEKSVDYIY